MGDHRASIKIEMEFHGVKDSVDMWINYFPGECPGVDDRIVEFFRGIYEEGMEVYNDGMEEYWERENREKIEADERKQLKRLKEKYEGGKM